jgi:hypothetical protein
MAFVFFFNITTIDVVCLAQSTMHASGLSIITHSDHFIRLSDLAWIGVVGYFPEWVNPLRDIIFVK